MISVLWLISYLEYESPKSYPDSDIRDIVKDECDNAYLGMEKANSTERVLSTLVFAG